jgi:hypothetical protein
MLRLCRVHLSAMKNPLIVLMSLLMVACTPLGTLTPPGGAAWHERQITAAELAKMPVPVTRVQAGDTLRIVRDAQESAVDVRSLVEDSQSQTYVVRPDGSFRIATQGASRLQAKRPTRWPCYCAISSKRLTASPA